MPGSQAGPGGEEGRLGLSLHHQVKTLDLQFEIFRELTCARGILTDLSAAPTEIARILDEALSLSRPVYIGIPRDLVDMP